MMIKHYWKFYAEFDDDGGSYLEEENVFIGTDLEAAYEADRRSNQYEDETGIIITKIIMESQGIVTH